MNDKLKTYGTIGLLIGGLSLAGSIERSAAKTCQEDDQCWTWSTMGNKERGVILKPGVTCTTRTSYNGTRCVVNAKQFCKLNKAKRIDWKRTERLRGDSFAKRKGC